MDSKKIYQHHAGFTLVEIVVVIGIIGILAAIATPNFLAWLPNYRLKAAVRDLQGHFQAAKLEAVKRGANVAIEFTTGAYDPGGRVGEYVVFSDTDSDEIFDAGEAVVVIANMPADVSLTAATFGANGNGNPAVFFNSRGLPNQGGTVTTRNSRDVSGQVVMNLTGRTRVERSVSADGGVTWPAYQQWD